MISFRFRVRTKRYKYKERSSGITYELLTNCIDLATDLPYSMKAGRSFTLLNLRLLRLLRRQHGCVLLDLHIAEHATTKALRAIPKVRKPVPT